jgi:arylsulfatase
MPHTRRDFIQNTVSAAVGGALALHGGVPVFADSAAAKTRAGAPAKAHGQRPNILLLFPDQWRFDWTSANPDLPIRTPNLDQLVKAGTRFTNTVVASPLCGPSRACLAAGMEYGKTGVASNAQDFPLRKIPTFYSLLRDSGYHVLACGKMDLAKAADWWGIDGKWRLAPLGFSDGINNAGKIDQVIGYELNNNRPADPYLTFLNERGLLQEHLQDVRSRMRGGYAATYPTPLPEDAYCDNWLARNGLDLLDAAPKDKPWFLQVNWTGPHNPEDITARMESEVRSLRMPAPNGKNQYNGAENQTIRQNYTAMCENIDRTIGLYLEKLDSLGQRENTIIIFSSDHGEMLGDHDRWGKIIPYQPSASVPLTIAGPGVAQGATSAALVNHIDLTATCLDYASVPVPKKMDCISLRPVLEQQSTKHRGVLFSGLGAWRMAFDGEYKAITGFVPNLKRNSPEWTTNSWQIQGAAPVIFNLASDPGENTDLYAAKPARGERLLRMLAANAAETMKREKASHGASGE